MLPWSQTRCSKPCVETRASLAPFVPLSEESWLRKLSRQYRCVVSRNFLCLVSYHRAIVCACPGDTITPSIHVRLRVCARARGVLIGITYVYKHSRFAQHKDRPHDNFLFYDGVATTAQVMVIGK
jgi:hypothetical protein